MMTIADVKVDAGSKTFATGLLPELIAAIRRCRRGDLVAVVSGNPALGPELEAWCRFTRNSLVDVAEEEGRTRWLIRHGEAPTNVDGDRPVGSRLWLYTNFDCNLSCDYCCVRSSPKAPRRALGLERIRRIAGEAATRSECVPNSDIDRGSARFTSGEALPFLANLAPEAEFAGGPERQSKYLVEMRRVAVPQATACSATLNQSEIS